MGPVAAALVLLLHLHATGACESWCNEWICMADACLSCGAEVGCPAKPPPPPGPPPLPQLPPWYEGLPTGEINFVAEGGFLWANGARFYIKGINWFGSEGRDGAGPPLGLDKHDIAWYMRFLTDNGFNAIRFLFNHETILSDPTLDPPDEAKYGVGAPWESPELEGYSYVDMFVKLAEVAAEHGILVMLTCHRLRPSAWPGDGKWFDSVITEERVKESWDKLADRLCAQWNVFAVDLQNEPHGSSWGLGMGEKSDWGHAAERLGNHVLSRCRRWLIMVEGIGYDPGSSDQDPAGGIFWGENLAGALQQPVQLSDPSKLVFSPHTYGPSVYEQDYFNSPIFPQNMPDIWDARFSFAPIKLGVPVVIGELGGFYTGNDKVWQDWAVEFIKERGIGIFYFALNPGSEDTGGLLLEDYTTPESAKLELLARLPSTEVLPLRNKRRPLAASPPRPPLPSWRPPPPTPLPSLPSFAPLPPASPPPPPLVSNPAPSPVTPLAKPLQPSIVPAATDPAAAYASKDSGSTNLRASPPGSLDTLEGQAIAAVCLLLILSGSIGVAIWRRSKIKQRASREASREGQVAPKEPGRRGTLVGLRRPRSQGHQRIGKGEDDSIFDDDSRQHKEKRHTHDRQAAPRPRQRERSRKAGHLPLPEACASGDEDPEPEPALSVREIKEQLAELGVGFADCIEKADLTRRLAEARRGDFGGNGCSSTALVLAPQAEDVD